MTKLMKRGVSFRQARQGLLAIALLMASASLGSVAAYPQCVPPPAGLVAWWPLDESTGATMVVDLAGGHIGTPISGPVGLGGPNSVTGMVGGALYIASANTYVSVLDNPALNFGAGDFTIDAWVYLRPCDSGNCVYPIVDKWDPNTQTGFSFYLYKTYSSSFFPANFGLYVTGNWFASLGNQAQIPTGSWVHVAVTVKRVPPWNWVETRFYVNGALVWFIPAAPMGNITNNVPLWIGKLRHPAPASLNFSSVDIDELELFNRALSDEEIQAIYNAGSAGKCKQVVDLTLTKKTLSTVVAGQPASYQIIVTNVGTAQAQGPVVVTDTLGPGLTYVSAIGSGWNCSVAGQTVTCVHPGPVPAGGSLPPITLTVQVAPDAQEVKNCAKVTQAEVEQPPSPEVPRWVYTPIPDANPDNDEACVISPVQGGTAEICIFKFHDVNGNGKKDPGEPGLSGWQFTVSPAPLSPATSPVVTGPEGAICFGVSAPGTYTITEQAQAGWASTTPTAQTVTVSPGQLVNVFFGNKRTEASADLGDAPDSTNHPSAKMMTYTPPITARFPTVFDPATGLPQGPKHLQPKGLAWLGKDASFEDEADSPPDADGVTNIDPAAGLADRDKFDDGVVLPVAIPLCGQTQFQYTVTSVAAATLYVNVWFDFNHDGDWEDTFKCPLGPATTGFVQEWAVQNEPITVPGPGNFVFTTPPFAAANPTKGTEMWMRITLTDQPILPAHGADGSGPAFGYKYGETEDYLLKLSYAEVCGVKFHDLNGNGRQDPNEPGLADWVIEAKDPSGNVMGYAVTNAEGKHCIVVPAPGTYTVAEQPQPGWTPTTPSIVTVTVPSSANVNFGNKRSEPVGQCDLEIRKVANRTTVGTGQQVTYTITVTNVGTATCPGPTTVTETVPPGLTLVSVSGFGWLCLGNACTYLLPIPPGGSVSLTYTFTVTAKPGTVIENCATVSNQSDTNLANNRACVAITVTREGGPTRP